MRWSGGCGNARLGLGGPVIEGEIGGEEGPSSVYGLATSFPSVFAPMADLLRALALSSLSSTPPSRLTIRLFFFRRPRG